MHFFKYIQTNAFSQRIEEYKKKHKSRFDQTSGTNVSTNWPPCAIHYFCLQDDSAKITDTKKDRHKILIVILTFQCSPIFNCVHCLKSNHHQQKYNNYFPRKA